LTFFFFFSLLLSLFYFFVAMIKRFFFLVVAVSLSGCATNPETGEQYWDVDTTIRAVGAAVNAIQKPARVDADNYNTYE
jgi:starvation-inducible outer membrane lipoprotein